MENVSFLGGSGYIGSLIKKYDFSIKKDIEFYSRRKTENCIQYTDLDELPNCEILFDIISAEVEKRPPNKNGIGITLFDKA